jgi:hypothetical protein
MSDIADDADEAQAAFLRAALAKVPKPTAPHGIGMCLNCQAEVDGERRWCDAACRDEWAKYRERA